MLGIRREQYEVFAQQARLRFEGEAVDYLRGCWPEETGELGPEGVLVLVRQGMGEAAGFAIEREAHVLRYLNLMLALGADFSAGETHPWAREILLDADADAGARLERLERRTAELLAGKDVP